MPWRRTREGFIHGRTEGRHLLLCSAPPFGGMKDMYISNREHDVNASCRNVEDVDDVTVLDLRWLGMQVPLASCA